MEQPAQQGRLNFLRNELLSRCEHWKRPDGISTLTGTDLIRVSAANILYSFATEVLELCCELNKLFMLENPRNSFVFGLQQFGVNPHAHPTYTFKTTKLAHMVAKDPNGQG